MKQSRLLKSWLKYESFIISKRRTDVSFKKVVVYIAFAIVICSVGFFTGSAVTKHRLVEQYRLESELARQRASVLTDTLDRARKEVGELGASLDRQRTGIAGLRELITEVRTRYEKMEKLLNSSIGYYDFDGRDFNSNNNTTEYEIEDDKCTTFTE